MPVGDALVSAIDLRVIGDDQIVAALMRVQSAGKQTFSGISAAARESSRDLVAVGEAADSVSRKFRGPLLNAIFQVQDIITQLSLGAPALQVISIQGAQMAQAFGPVPAILGTVAAAVGALAGAWWGAKSAVEAAADATDKLSSAVDGQIERLLSAANNAAALREHYASLSVEQQKLINLTLQMTQLEAERTLENVTSGMREKIDDIRAGLEKDIRWLRAQLDVLGREPLFKTDESIRRRQAEIERVRSKLEELETKLRGIFDPIAQGLETRDLGLLLDTLELIRKSAPDAEMEALAGELLKMAKAAAQAQAELERVKRAREALAGRDVELTAGAAIPTPKSERSSRSEPADRKTTPRVIEDLTRAIAQQENELLKIQLMRSGATREEAELKARILDIDRSIAASGGDIDEARVAALRDQFIEIAAQVQEAKRNFDEITKLRTSVEAAIAREEEELLRLSLLRQGVAEDELDTKLELLEIEKALRQLGETPDAENLEKMRGRLEEVSAKVEESRRQWEAYRESLENIQEAGRAVGASISQALANIVSGARSATQAARELLASIAQMIFDRTIGAAIANTVSSVIGAVIPTPVPAASGSVFSSATVVPFASGGIIPGPLAFSLPARRIGVVGEAGPEAVLPLRRMNNGRLGVEASASPQRVVIEVMNKAENVKIEAPRNGPSGETYIKMYLESLVQTAVDKALSRRR